MNGAHAIHNGNLIPKEEATLPIDSIELLYGYGVYETIKLRKGQLFSVQDHLDRLFSSAEKIDLVHNFKKEQVKDWINELVKKNALDSTNIKIIVLGGGEPDLFIFMVNPLYVEKKEYREGSHATTFVYERFLPEAKSLNMLGSYIAYKEAKKENAYDAILIDHNGFAIEGTRSNLFFIKDKTLVTAPKEYILNGVTRRTVIDCAQQHGYALKEKRVHKNEMFDYDGAFLTNTSGKIVPLKSIDDSQYPEITPPLAELRKLYDDYLKKKTKQH